MHSSGQGALIKTHCLYSLQQASSRPRCSPDVHPPPPRPSQLRSQGFSPTSFQVVLRNHLTTAFLRDALSLLLLLLPLYRHLLSPGCFLAKTFLVKEEGAFVEIVCTVLVDCLARKQRSRAIPRIAERRFLFRERETEETVDGIISRQWDTYLLVQ